MMKACSLGLGVLAVWTLPLATAGAGPKATAAKGRLFILPPTPALGPGGAVPKRVWVDKGEIASVSHSVDSHGAGGIKIKASGGDCVVNASIGYERRAGFLMEFLALKNAIVAAARSKGGEIRCTSLPLGKVDNAVVKLQVFQLDAKNGSKIEIIEAP
jgi:hypothetical protein